MIAAMSAVEFSAPEMNYAALSPLLVVFGAAIVGVLVEAFVPRGARALTQVVVSVLGLVGAGVAVGVYALQRDSDIVTAGSSIAVDGVTLFLQGTLVFLSLLAVLTMADRTPEIGDAFTAQASAVPRSPDEAAAQRAGFVQTEVFPLLLFSVGGMMLFPASNDLLTMFVALEVLSLPLYLLCGLARRRRLLSQEASLKYFLLGAFSSGFFLYGAALVYGFAGSVSLPRIADAVSGTSGLEVLGQDPLLLAGVGLLAVGLLFKIGAAPFHVWTPDVYQGAPTQITGFMGACTKVAAFGALLRVTYVAIPGIRWDWQPALFVVAILTMLIGSVVAVVQADVKRMLAYSSIAHAGFVLVGVLSVDKAGLSGTLFYLVAYGLTTIGAFAIVTLVRTQTADGGVGSEATHLSKWAGLGRRSPVVAALFTLFLLAFAGIPLTSGFMGKYAVFSAALDSFGTAVPHGGAWLVVVGVLTSAIAAFFYARVIVLMYFSPPSDEDTTVIMPGMGTSFAVAVAAIATVVLGVYPSLILDIAEKSSAFVR